MWLSPQQFAALLSTRASGGEARLARAAAPGRGHRKKFACGGLRARASRRRQREGLGKLMRCRCWVGRSSPLRRAFGRDQARARQPLDIQKLTAPGVAPGTSVARSPARAAFRSGRGGVAGSELRRLSVPPEQMRARAGAAQRRFGGSRASFHVGSQVPGSAAALPRCQSRPKW